MRLTHHPCFHLDITPSVLCWWVHTCVILQEDHHQIFMVVPMELLICLNLDYVLCVSPTLQVGMDRFTIGGSLEVAGLCLVQSTVQVIISL